MSDISGAVQPDPRDARIAELEAALKKISMIATDACIAGIARTALYGGDDQHDYYSSISF